MGTATENSYVLIHYGLEIDSAKSCCELFVSLQGKELKLLGEGTDPTAAIVNAFNRSSATDFKIVGCKVCHLSGGFNEAFVTQAEISTDDGRNLQGTGKDGSRNASSIKAILDALSSA